MPAFIITVHLYRFIIIFAALNGEPGEEAKRFSTANMVWIAVGVIAVLGTITGTALMLLPSNGQLNEPGDGDDNRYNIPINSSIGI